jgi:hypothetical protein
MARKGTGHHNANVSAGVGEPCKLPEFNWRVESQQEPA